MLIIRSKEDSLGSFLHLQPKVPRKHFKKLMENTNETLRFAAKFCPKKSALFLRIANKCEKSRH